MEEEIKNIYEHEIKELKENRKIYVAILFMQVVNLILLSINFLIHLTK